LEEFVVNPFIPSIYLPNQRDVRFFGAMGIMGIIAYGVAFFGALAFTEFTLYAFDMNKPMARNAEYYRGRLLFYTFILVLAGTSQLLLGVYSLTEYGSGPLEPPLVVAMYTISFPEIAITLGILQMLVGYFGMARYLGYVPVGPKNHEYQIMLLIQFIAMVALQYLTQIGYAPDNDDEDEGATTGAGTIISLVLLSVGLNVLPAFLDYKMRTMPQPVTKEYFGITASSGGANNPKGRIKPEPLGGFAALGSSISSETASAHLNNDKDIEAAIKRERKLGGDSSDEDNSAWEATTTDSSGPRGSNPIEMPKPLVSEDEEIVGSVPTEANDKDTSLDSDKSESVPIPVPVQMQMRDDDDDEVITPHDEDGEGNGRPPITVEEEVIMPADMDEEVSDNGRPPIVVEEEVIIDAEGNVFGDDGEHSQDPSEDNTPPASNQSKEWDDTAGWIDQPDIEGGTNNSTRSDSPVSDIEYRDEAGVKRGEPEQVITLSNSHHDEDESDEDEEYANANDMKELYKMIDPPEVKTPVSVKAISYPKSGKPFSFGTDDIQDTASVISMSGSDDSSEPGGRNRERESMSGLTQRLEDIEKELFTHSMDAYNKSLADIF
jgi:hypothetical protein